MLGPDGEEERGLHTAHVPGVGISLLKLQKLMAQSRQSAKLFSSRRNWDSPNPSPENAPSLWFRGKGHTRWRERGWESPNSDEGTSTVVLCKYMYFLVNGEVKWRGIFSL
jgi:hypothetical protein